MITHQISLDMQKSQRRVTLRAKQGDALTRVVEISMYNNGTAWTPPAELTIKQVVFCKSDRQGGAYDTMPAAEYDATKAYNVGDYCSRIEGDEIKYYTCKTPIPSGGETWDATHWNAGGEPAVDVASNKATVKIAPEVLTCAGKTAVELQLLSANGSQISTWTFYFDVSESVEREIESKSYYNVQTIAGMQQAIAAALKIEYGNYEAHGNRIVHLADPIDASDAATLGSVLQLLESVSRTDVSAAYAAAKVETPSLTPEAYLADLVPGRYVLRDSASVSYADNDTPDGDVANVVSRITQLTDDDFVYEYVYSAGHCIKSIENSGTTSFETPISVPDPEDRGNATPKHYVDSKIKTIEDFAGIIPAFASGFIQASSSKWAAVATGGKCLIVPVSALDTIYIKANSSQSTQYAFLRSYTTPVQRQAADLIGSVVSLAKDNQATVSVPSEAQYLYLLITRLSGTSLLDCKPAACTINGFSILGTIAENIGALQSKINNGDSRKIDKNEGVFSVAAFAEGDEYDASTNPSGWEEGAYWDASGRKENNNWKTTAIIENKQKLDLYIQYTAPRPNYVFRITGYNMTDPSAPVYISGSYLALTGDADHSFIRLPYDEKLQYFRVGYYYKSSAFSENAFAISYYEENENVYNIEKRIPVDKIYGFDVTAKKPILSNTKRISDIEVETVINIPYVTSAAKDAFDRIVAWAGTDKVSLIGQITDVHNQFDKISQLKKLNELFEFDAIIHNGDMAIGPFDPPLTLEEKNQVIIDTKRRMNCTAPWVFVNGNHDGPVYRDDFDVTSLATLLNSPLSKRFQGVVLSEDCSYGYIDLSFAKIRLIFLNTSERTETSTNYRISDVQYSFLIDALGSVPAGFNVFITSHVVPDATITGMKDQWKSGVISDWNYYKYVQILNDFNAKKASAIGSLSWDFTNIPSTTRIICVLCGHEHVNANHVLAVSEDAGSSVNYIVRQGYGYHATDSGSDTDYTMESGYVAKYDNFEHSENCLLDIVAIKPDAGIAKVFRVGEGATVRDLEFTWW